MFPVLIEDIFCWLQFFFLRRVTCCRKCGRNMGNNRAVLLKIGRVAKKGLGDIQLDNPHGPTTQSK